MKKNAVIEKVELSHTSRKAWRVALAGYRNQTVQEVAVLGLLEYIPGKDRGTFMDELYRILVPGGKATIAAAYWTTASAVQDYLVEWPMICEQSFLFFN